MYEVSVSSDFAAAHRLRGYEGSCERLHGHNWRVKVVLRADAVDGLGMAYDFREAKRSLSKVLAGLDHAYLNEDVAAFGRENPTTENIARHIFDAMKGEVAGRVGVARVTVWESAGCSGSYCEE